MLWWLYKKAKTNVVHLPHETVNHILTMLIGEQGQKNELKLTHFSPGEQSQILRSFIKDKYPHQLFSTIKIGNIYKFDKNHIDTGRCTGIDSCLEVAQLVNPDGHPDQWYVLEVPNLIHFPPIISLRQNTDENGKTISFTPLEKDTRLPNITVIEELIASSEIVE